MHEISYSLVKDKEELKQILFLQQSNLKKNITEEDAQINGFVTVEHTLDLLYQMHLSKPSVVAKLNGVVIGYVLVMTKGFCNSIPVLKPMFDQFNKTYFNQKLISNYTYFVMGQICIDKNYRGTGIFKKLYTTLASEYANTFQCILTEVSAFNQRSVQAHLKIGMQEISEYTHGAEIWKIFLFDLQPT